MGMFTSDPVSLSFCTCLWKKTMSLRGLLVKAVPTVGLSGDVAWWHRPYNFVKNFASNPVPGVLGSCVAAHLLVGHYSLARSETSSCSLGTHLASQTNRKQICGIEGVYQQHLCSIKVLNESDLRHIWQD